MNRKAQLAFLIVLLVTAAATASAIGSDSDGNHSAPTRLPASWLGVQVDDSGRVLKVFDGSPAAAAAIQTGDKIVSINGSSTPIVGARKLIMGLQGAANLVIEREGKRYRCAVAKVAMPQTKSKDPDDSDDSPQSNENSQAKRYVADDIDQGIVSILRNTDYTANAYNQVIEALHTVPLALVTYRISFHICCCPQQVNSATNASAAGSEKAHGKCGFESSDYTDDHRCDARRH